MRKEDKKETKGRTGISSSKSSVLLRAVRPEYKLVKDRKPHCPICKEMLSGNNSMLLPYKCSCGTWKQNTADLTFNIEST